MSNKFDETKIKKHYAGSCMEFINIPTQSEIDEMKLRLAKIDRIYKTMIGIYIVEAIVLPLALFFSILMWNTLNALVGTLIKIAFVVVFAVIFLVQLEFIENHPGINIEAPKIRRILEFCDFYFNYTNFIKDANVDNIVSELKLPIPSGHGRLNFSLQKKQKAEIS